MYLHLDEVFSTEELTDVFKQLIQIPSENPGDFEEKIALKIQSILKEEGIDSELKYVDENRTNLYAILEGEMEGKTLLYNGHLDTVPAGGNWEHNPFSAYEDDEGYIYGRGAADMKSGVAAMLYATICLKRLGYPKKGRLILFLNADEEVFNIGMHQFLKENIEVDYAIISEPTDLDIAIGHKGTARYTIHTKGTAGHAAYVLEPDNAIQKMNIILSTLFQYSEGIRKLKPHDFFGSATSNVTTIEGGITENIIPNSCSIIVDRRVLPGETNKGVLAEYNELLTETDVEYEINTKTFVPSFLLDKEHSLVKSVYDVIEKNQENVKIKAFEATCEAPFLAVEKDIPTIIYGPGSLNQAHVTNERVHKSQLETAGRNFVFICLSLLENEVDKL
ncbi:M20 family metallopeptidase [Pseudogracilibacillus sp. SE30717A]|uniref:M20 family metallopeptidase n=1 Tax=Pseudogracilibacillus sp. SE30717A TaxID=3098293 RepID=UPI00300E3F95